MSLQKRADTDLLCSDICHKLIRAAINSSVETLPPFSSGLFLTSDWHCQQCEIGGISNVRCVPTILIEKKNLARGELCTTICATLCSSWRS